MCVCVDECVVCVYVEHIHISISNSSDPFTLTVCRVCVCVDECVVCVYVLMSVLCVCMWNTYT